MARRIHELAVGDKFNDGYLVIRTRGERRSKAVSGWEARILAC